MAKITRKMNWDFFNGFWVGALSLLFVEFALIWSVEEKDDDDSDDDDYHYEPIDDDITTLNPHDLPDFIGTSLLHSWS